MRTAVNLASRPFTNHRLLWIALITISVASAWSILWVAGEKAKVSALADAEKQKIDDQRKAFEQAQAEEEARKQAEMAAVISQHDAYQLAGARLLLERKSLSWTRILSNLENYVPKNARITSIKVEEISDGGNALTARIEVKAIGQAASEMTEMMGSLDKSAGLFEVGQAIQEPTTDAGEVPFSMNLIYRPGRGAQQ
jgi:Tfp pilus assembly protein PilN